VVALCATIITYNEQANIGRCLDSLAGIADDIVVVDSYSQDRTAEICAAHSVRFVRHEFEGHIQQKNYALALATSDYILALDADEALTEKLRESILHAKENWSADGFLVHRRTNYCGRWISHSGWYPDRKIRLWNRSKGRWAGVNPHDRVIMNEGSRIARLDGDLLHYSYSSSRQHLDQIDRFSSIAADEAYRRGRRARLISDILLNPALTFLKKYLLQAGFLDGGAGLKIAARTAQGKFLKYGKLRRLEQEANAQEGKKDENRHLPDSRNSRSG
jgi:glycosyltransferase involved in cell wall biosynthesis